MTHLACPFVRTDGSSVDQCGFVNGQEATGSVYSSVYLHRSNMPANQTKGREKGEERNKTILIH